MLEVLHPDGFARCSLVLGSACPPGLVGRDANGHAGGAADLVVLAPSRRESRRQDWLSAAVGSLAAGLATDGIGYVIVPRGRRSPTRRLLADAGLEAGDVFAHFPALAHTRHLVPLQPGPLRHVVSALLSSNRWERRAGMLASRAPRRALAELLGSTGLVVRHPGARPAFEWLAGSDGGLLAISRSWHSRYDGLVLRRFERGRSQPTAIAKLKLDPDGTPVTTAEASALSGTARLAAAAGADVPSLLSVTHAGPRAVLVQTALCGRVAATALQSTPRLLVPTLDRLAAWLGRWHESTCTSPAASVSELEQALLRPATEVAAHVRGGPEYLSWLEQRFAGASGEPLPRVGVHNDLTMWNVLLREHGAVGIVDWEGAEGAGLPLVDFYYAAVDAAAATAGYRDRPAAFRSCFVRGGRHAEQITRLDHQLRAVLGLTPRQAELCFHACWLAHATDERRSTRPSDRLPFLHIVDWLARNRGALALTLD